MAAAATTRNGTIAALGGQLVRLLTLLGDITLFSLRVFRCLARRPAPGTLLPNFYLVGVRSVPMVALTGMFIGMVMAVQTFHEFHRLGMATRLGSMINITLVRELGPVLAATMLAGRVGSAMAAELATMRVTEQVDALSCLGAEPIHYLVLPRFLACTLLVPLLTILADFMGIMGGALICTRIFGVEAHFYWQHSENYITAFDIFNGLIKSCFFGACLGLISCHRGLNSQPGAEGVGRSATEAFVASFVAILILDFFLGMLLVNLQEHFLAGFSRRFM